MAHRHSSCRLGRRGGLAVLAACVVFGTALAPEIGAAPPTVDETVDLLVVNLNLSAAVTAGSAGVAAALEALRPGLRTAILHYPRFTRGEMLRLRPRALVLSPQGDPWWTYPKEDIEHLSDLVRELDIPVLGICGGHQFLAIAFGGLVAPMRGEAGTDGYARMTREEGLVRLRVVRASPLLVGKKPGDALIVRENHVEEIKDLPAVFEVIAEGDTSRIQAIQHVTKPIYGVQFHPERSDDTNPDGRMVLEGFLRLVDAIPPSGGSTSRAR